MINRVLLIQPFSTESKYNLDQVKMGGVQHRAPLGLGYIAAYLKMRLPEIEVEVYDANAVAVEHILATNRVEMDELWSLYRDKVFEFKPDMVGVSCLFHTIAATANRSIDEAKNAYPKCLTVMGGNYPSGSPEDALRNKNLDYVIFSEGDFSFTQLIDSLNNSEDPIRNVEGIAYYEGNQYKYRPKGGMIDNLDEIPLPDRTHFHMDLYANARCPVHRVVGREDIRSATMTASRGCPFVCTFCSSKDFWGRSMRYRSPGNVVDEMIRLIDEYDINCFVFNDDNVLANPRNIVSLAEAIAKAKLDITWISGGGMQVSALTPKVIEALYKSGLVWFNLAIETGNRETLRKIKKPLKDGEAAERVIRHIRELGDGWICSNFITGFPFETKQDIKENLNYLQALDLDWKCIYTFQAYPGTADYDYCVEKGYLKPFELWREGEQSEMLTFSTENFDADWVQKENYLVNLQVNFLNNRNINVNPEQAIRDFDYVSEMVPDHAFANYSRGEAYLNLGKYETARKEFEIANDLVVRSQRLKDSLFKYSAQVYHAEVKWYDYFEHFNIDVKQRLQELSSLQV